MRACRGIVGLAIRAALTAAGLAGAHLTDSDRPATAAAAAEKLPQRTSKHGLVEP